MRSFSPSPLFDDGTKENDWKRDAHLFIFFVSYYPARPAYYFL
jgi:hypothetical protein